MLRVTQWLRVPRWLVEKKRGGGAVRGMAESGAWPRLADGLLRLDARGEPELDLEDEVGET